MKKWLVVLFAVLTMAISCIALSACNGSGSGNSSADYVGVWQFQSLKDTDGTEHKIGEFYQGSAPNNELMSSSYSIEIREQDLGYEGKTRRMFQLRNWIGYPADLQETVTGSWTFDKSEITLKGTNGNSVSRTYTAILKDGFLSVE